MSEPNTMRIYARIVGRVQGVSFRAYTLRKARELGLTGWVQNTTTGDVATVAEGTYSSLLDFEKFLREGSPSSHVVSVNSLWQDATGEFDNFQIRYF